MGTSTKPNNKQTKAPVVETKSTVTKEIYQMLVDLKAQGDVVSGRVTDLAQQLTTIQGQLTGVTKVAEATQEIAELLQEELPTLRLLHHNSLNQQGAYHTQIEEGCEMLQEMENNLLQQKGYPIAPGMTDGNLRMTQPGNPGQAPLAKVNKEDLGFLNKLFK